MLLLSPTGRWPAGLGYSESTFCWDLAASTTPAKARRRRAIGKRVWWAATAPDDDTRWRGLHSAPFLQRHVRDSDTKRLYERGFCRFRGRPVAGVCCPARGARVSPGSTAAVQWLKVDEESDGQRLDNFLFRTLKGVPKSHVYRIIRSGEVRLNHGRAEAAARVAAGDVVRVPPVRVAADADRRAEQTAPPRAFAVLYEDEHLLALDKPAGVAVHGGSGVSWGVIEALRAARPEATLLELVHRLDRETSGVLLVAKRRSALRQLQDQFRQRQTHKTYLALVAGCWPESRRVVDVPLQKVTLSDGERRVRAVAADHPEALRSISLVKPLARGRLEQALPTPQGSGEVSLLAVTIKTGRTHQIRVHLSSSGHPIAGDDKYGHFDWNRRLQQLGLKRMFLHAWRLGFVHPVSDSPVDLQAPLPPELTRALQRAGISPDILHRISPPNPLAARHSKGNT